MKTNVRGRSLLAVLALAAGVTQGCRRDADDKGVGTSSVGAGGANGAAPNNNRKAEPTPGTGQAAPATTEPSPAPPPPAAEQSKKSGG